MDEDVYYSLITKKIIKMNEEIVLTKNEILFFELLLDKPNHLVSKELVENLVYKEFVEENTLRNMVYRLRKKLDYQNILTIKDLGYLLKLE